MVKHKIYKYFFVEFFKIFLIILFSLSILIWLTQAARLLDLVTEFGNSFEVYFKYLVFNLPKIVDNIFILSFVVSIFFVFAKLESSNELNIYWLSGINKIEIFKICFLIALFLLFTNLVISIFLAPWSSLNGREILGKSKFTLINSLVKEQNFNSPLKGLTIYVERNDNKGNLDGIFIYEKNRTIIAKKGRVLSQNNSVYLELLNGTTQEKVKEKINFINFKSTIFDFSKYQLLHTTYPKLNERSIIWLIKNLKNTQKKTKEIREIREEINKRLIKPFLILIISVLGCFLLYQNNEKINLKKLRFTIYLVSIFFIIINQVLLIISGKNLYFSLIYFLLIIVIFLILFLTLIKTLKNETRKNEKILT